MRPKKKSLREPTRLTPASSCKSTTMHASSLSVCLYKTFLVASIVSYISTHLMTATAAPLICPFFSKPILVYGSVQSDCPTNSLLRVFLAHSHKYIHITFIKALNPFINFDEVPEHHSLFSGECYFKSSNLASMTVFWNPKNCFCHHLGWLYHVNVHCIKDRNYNALQSYLMLTAVSLAKASSNGT